MADHKLEIGRVLKALDQKNISFFDSLDETEKKAFQPLIVARMLSGTASKRQVMMLNQVVNPYIFKLTNHKGLLCKLMTICTSGEVQRYDWMKPQLKSSSFPISVKVIQQYWSCNSVEAERSRLVLSTDDLLEAADELGWQDDDLNKLRKELGLTAIKKPKSRSVSNVEAVKWEL